MKIKDLKQEIIKNNPLLEEKLKRDLPYQIGKVIVEARLIKGYTQSKLAEKMGTKQPSIARIEGGSSLPSLAFLQKMAEAFDSYLLPIRFAFMNNNTSDNISTTTTSFMPISVLSDRSSIISGYRGTSNSPIQNIQLTTMV